MFPLSRKWRVDGYCYNMYIIIDYSHNYCWLSSEYRAKYESYYFITYISLPQDQEGLISPFNVSLFSESKRFEWHASTLHYRSNRSFSNTGQVDKFNSEVIHFNSSIIRGGEMGQGIGCTGHLGRKKPCVLIVVWDYEAAGQVLVK